VAPWTVVGYLIAAIVVIALLIFLFKLIGMA
jgi:hypothetical protein